LRKIENMLMYITLFNQNIFLAGKQRNCSVSGLVFRKIAGVVFSFCTVKMFRF